MADLVKTIVDPTETLNLTERDIADFRTPVKYCVSQDEHMAHVRAAIARGYPSIPAARETTYDPIGIVCSGPSLKETWPEVRKFSKVMSCSGAHDFLIERGIPPTHHIETDPRAHKAVFVQSPHRAVQYLIASCCHPAVFDALAGHDVRLWHVVQGEDERLLPSIYPRGHWLLTGGSNAGLRALVLARVLGFTNIHVFGMDCSGDEATFHANETQHPNEPKDTKRRTVKVGDRIFTTTEVFLEYARQFFSEIEKMPDVHFTLHGDALLQNLAVQKLNDPEAIRKRLAALQAKQGLMSTIAMMVPPVISDEHLQVMRTLHEQRGWRGEYLSEAGTVEKLIASSGARTVLDYGSGNSALAKDLSIPIWEYDPAVPGKDQAPRPADLVVCFNVLQCVEPEYLDAVLADLARCVVSLGYFVISTGPSATDLPDGRNAHLIQHDAARWREQLARFFFLKEGAVIEQWATLRIVVGAKGA